MAGGETLPAKVILSSSSSGRRSYGLLITARTIGLAYIDYCTRCCYHGTRVGVCVQEKELERESVTLGAIGPESSSDFSLMRRTLIAANVTLYISSCTNKIQSMLLGAQPRGKLKPGIEIKGEYVEFTLHVCVCVSVCVRVVFHARLITLPSPIGRTWAT